MYVGNVRSAKHEVFAERLVSMCNCVPGTVLISFDILIYVVLIVIVQLTECEDTRSDCNLIDEKNKAAYCNYYRNDVEVKKCAKTCGFCKYIPQYLLYFYIFKSKKCLDCFKEIIFNLT
jgi:hypothetical protein